MADFSDDNLLLPFERRGDKGSDDEGLTGSAQELFKARPDGKGDVQYAPDQQRANRALASL